MVLTKVKSNMTRHWPHRLPLSTRPPVSARPLKHVAEGGLLFVRHISCSSIFGLNGGFACCFKLVPSFVLPPINEPKYPEIQNRKPEEDGQDRFARTIMRRSLGLECLRSNPVSHSIRWYAQYVLVKLEAGNSPMICTALAVAFFV